MSAHGKLDWAISGGKIPFTSHGGELDSFDGLSVLNTSEKTVLLDLFVLYEDAPPVGPFQVSIPSERVRKIRFNDLIDPFPIQLERSYGCLVRASSPVVVQFIRLHAGQDKLGLSGSMAFPVEP